MPPISSRRGDPGWTRTRELLASGGRFLPLLPVLAYLLILYVYPLLQIFKLSLFDPEPTLRHYQHFLRVSVYADRLIFTFRIALLVTGMSVLLGYPVAFLLTTVSTRTRNVLLMMVVVPFWISILVRTYAWMVLLGRDGLINNVLSAVGLIATPLRLIHNTFGVYIGMVHVLLPFAILPMYSVMQGIDVDLLKAAQSLGANSLRSFLRVFLPLSLPGVAGAALLVLILALGFYVTPVLLGGPSDIMIANLIDMQISQFLNWGFGSTLAIVLLAVSMSVFYVYNRFLGLDRLIGGFQ